MKKPWPSDAVMIVASHAGQERRERMEGVAPAECRDCGAALTADTFTIRVAEQLPIRHGRPVKFFCTDCVLDYDVNDIEELHDHAGIKGKPRTVYRR